MPPPTTPPSTPPTAPHANPAATPPADDVTAVQRCEQAYIRIRDELAKVIVGQDEVIEQVLVAVFARGLRCSKECWAR